MSDTKRLTDTLMKNARAGKMTAVRNNGELALKSGDSMSARFWQGYHHYPFKTLSNDIGSIAYKAGKKYRTETDEFVGLPSNMSGRPYKDWK